MKKFLLVTSVVCTMVSSVWAQSTIKGTVSSEGENLPGVSVLVEGSAAGTVTDIDGNYSVEVPSGSNTLIFTFIGMATEKVDIGGRSVIDVSMRADATQLTEVVVTALGVKREKKSLGYATQQIEGDDLTKVNSGNVANSISGKISGVEIRRNGNIGGSTNVVIRGTNSLTGNNQALWVVDGIPLNNDNTNTADQRQGGNTGGYDYGNAASDINPDDIESMNVLKGAAASALYGSRARNGVIIITTKKGSKNKGIGVTINSGITIGTVDKSTLPEYQKEYGSGWWNPFEYRSMDIDLGDGLHPYEPTDDASWGPAYDEDLLVYRWNSFYPELSTYGKATPWTAPENDANSFYQNSVAYTNSVAFAGGNEQGSFRLNYTNYNMDQGILPNSSFKRNNFNFSSDYKLAEKTTIAASANYTQTRGEGLNEVGYGAGGNNYLSSVRQWYSSSIDFKDLEKAYNETGDNTTWSVWGPTDLGVAFHDNPYFQREQNYNNVDRDRLFGNFSITQGITDWLSVTGRAGIDTYSQTQEERIAVGSKRQSQLAGQYSRFDKRFTETNLDLFLNFDTQITESIEFLGMIGGNIRRTENNSTFAVTNGGLVVPDIYAISNSVDTPNNLTENSSIIGTNSVFANASFNFLGTYFIEGSYRLDQTSTLPTDNNSYGYPSITGTYIFSEHLKTDWLSFAKARVNYAETGVDAPFAVLSSGYDKFANFGGETRFSVENTRNNPLLKPERTKGVEAGLEFKLFENRVGLDFSVYKTNTTDQIIQVGVPVTSGYSFAYINAGDIESKGVELSLNTVPVKIGDFSWEVGVNWSKNKSVVNSLNDGAERLTIGGSQGVALTADVGETLGNFVSSGFEYLDGERVVDANGRYVTVQNQVIGNITPDWIGGINNTLRYKDFTFSFLIDVKKGGDIWSLDQKWGNETGLYQSTVGPNHLGNPRRDPVTNDDTSGGVILDGVLADGSANTQITSVYWHNDHPDEMWVYDASYIKLREVSLSYSLPKGLLANSKINGVTFSANALNLWIISKNMPYADPEAGFSSGNNQGFQTGAMPMVREFNFNVKLQF